MPLDGLLEVTASKEPVPGGGGIAAMTAASAAALVEMVANLTIGKKRYADVEDEIKGLLARMEDLQKEFVILADRGGLRWRHPRRPPAQGYAGPGGQGPAGLQGCGPVAL